MNLKTRSYPYLVLFLLTIGGLALRLTGLTFGLPSATHSLTTYHPDEAIHMYSLEKMKPAQWDFYPGDALYWGSFHIYLQGALSEIARRVHLLTIGNRAYLLSHLKEADKLYIIGRIISVMFGTVAILMMFLLAREFTDRTTAIIAALLWAISPLPVVTSLYAKPDGVMSFWLIVSLYFSARLYRTGSWQDYVLSGIMIGICGATKYSGLIAMGFMAMAHAGRALEQKSATHNLNKLIIGSMLAPLAFVLVNPYSIIRFHDFYWRFSGMVFSKSSFPPHVITGLIEYLHHNLPTALGAPLVILSFAGAILLLTAHRSYIHIAAVLFAGCYILRFGPPLGQSATYAMPVLPFLTIFAAFAIQRIAARKAGIVIAAAAIVYTGMYTVQYKGLFTAPDTRMMASRWISEHISVTDPIGIPRSDAWTPAIIKNPDTAYTVIAGSPSQAAMEVAMTGLGEKLSQCRYVVITDYEYPFFLADPVKYSVPCRVVHTLFGPEWKQEAVFEKNISFFGMPYYYPYATFDWLIPNPKIIIFKRADTASTAEAGQ